MINRADCLAYLVVPAKAGIQFEESWGTDYTSDSQPTCLPFGTMSSQHLFAEFNEMTKFTIRRDGMNGRSFLIVGQISVVSGIMGLEQFVQLKHTLDEEGETTFDVPELHVVEFRKSLDKLEIQYEISD